LRATTGAAKGSWWAVLIWCLIRSPKQLSVQTKLYQARTRSRMAWGLSAVGVWPLATLLLAHTLLPNSIEKLLLTSELQGGVYATALILSAAVALLTTLHRRMKLLTFVVALVYLAVLVTSQSSTTAHGTEADELFAFLLYLLPLAGVSAAWYLSHAPRVGRVLVLSVLTIIGLQGLMALVNIFFPFLENLPFVQQGEAFREGFATYRFGSTAASANTSGCLLALCVPAAYRYLVDKRFRHLILLLAAVAILGFQSRSGALILFLVLLSIHSRARLRHIMFAVLVSAVALAVVHDIRESEEVSSSNAYRWALALEAYNALNSASIAQLLLGHGPNAAVEKDLANYYGADEIQLGSILTSSESALLVMILDIGLLGTALLISLVHKAANNSLMTLALVVFITLDPSFSRPYECLLATILVCLAPKVRNPAARKSSPESHEVPGMLVRPCST